MLVTVCCRRCGLSHASSTLKIPFLKAAVEFHVYMLVLHRRNVPAFWVEARGETNWQLVTGCAWTFASRGLIKGHRTETLHPDSFRRYPTYDLPLSV